MVNNFENFDSLWITSLVDRHHNESVTLPSALSTGGENVYIWTGIEQFTHMLDQQPLSQNYCDLLLENMNVMLNHNTRIINDFVAITSDPNCNWCKVLVHVLPLSMTPMALEIVTSAYIMQRIYHNCQKIPQEHVLCRIYSHCMQRRWMMPVLQRDATNYLEISNSIVVNDVNTSMMLPHQQRTLAWMQSFEQRVHSMPIIYDFHTQHIPNSDLFVSTSINCFFTKDLLKPQLDGTKLPPSILSQITSGQVFGGMVIQPMGAGILEVVDQLISVGYPETAADDQLINRGTQRPLEHFSCQMWTAATLIICNGNSINHWKCQLRSNNVPFVCIYDKRTHSRVTLAEIRSSRVVLTIDSFITGKYYGDYFKFRGEMCHPMGLVSSITYSKTKMSQLHDPGDAELRLHDIWWQRIVYGYLPMQDFAVNSVASNGKSVRLSQRETILYKCFSAGYYWHLLCPYNLPSNWRNAMMPHALLVNSEQWDNVKAWSSDITLQLIKKCVYNDQALLSLYTPDVLHHYVVPHPLETMWLQQTERLSRSAKLNQECFFQELLSPRSNNTFSADDNQAIQQYLDAYFLAQQTNIQSKCDIALEQLRARGVDMLDIFARQKVADTQKSTLNDRKTFCKKQIEEYICNRNPDTGLPTTPFTCAVCLRQEGDHEEENDANSIVAFTSLVMHVPCGHILCANCIQGVVSHFDAVGTCTLCKHTFEKNKMVYFLLVNHALRIKNMEPMPSNAPYGAKMKQLEDLITSCRADNRVVFVYVDTLQLAEQVVRQLQLVFPNNSARTLRGLTRSKHSIIRGYLQGNIDILVVAGLSNEVLLNIPLPVVDDMIFYHPPQSYLPHDSSDAERRFVTLVNNANCLERQQQQLQMQRKPLRVHFILTNNGVDTQLYAASNIFQQSDTWCPPMLSSMPV